ncbi:MAG: hypothetical protein QOI78_3516, partial [Actinomycetota bacterium]|nr:hypothetical protein [Actinomycetota bacterium]
LDHVGVTRGPVRKLPSFQLATLKLTSTQMDKVREAGQVNGVREWPASYSDALARAVTDSDVTGPPLAGRLPSRCTSVRRT